MKNKIIMFLSLAVLILGMSSCSFLALRSGRYTYTTTGIPATSPLVNMKGSFELDKYGKVVNTSDMSGILDKDGFDVAVIDSYINPVTGSITYIGATMRGKSDSIDQISGDVYRGLDRLGSFLAKKQK